MCRCPSVWSPLSASIIFSICQMRWKSDDLRVTQVVWMAGLFGSTDNTAQRPFGMRQQLASDPSGTATTRFFFLWVVCSNLRNRYHLRLISCSCIRVCIKMQLEINFVFQIFSRPNACVIIAVSFKRFSRTSCFKCRGIVNVYVMRYELWTRVERVVRFWKDPHLNIVNKGIAYLK